MNQKAIYDRIFLLDFLKALSIIAVVSFHGIFVPESAYAISKYWVDILFSPLRFCVPILFTISFFLLKKSIDENCEKNIFELAKIRLSRILMPTFFWFLIAGFIRQMGRAPVWLPLVQGKIFPGAYYLLAMIVLMPLFFWVSPWLAKLRNLTIFLIAQCCVFGLIYLCIIHLPNSHLIQGLRLMARSFPIYWFVYMAIGAYFYENYPLLLKCSMGISIKVKSLSIIVTALLISFEYGYLRHIVGEQPRPFEYAMFSCIVSVFTLFLCFANIEANNFPKWALSMIQNFSRYSLGIFCINGITSLVLLKIGISVFRDSQFSLLEITIFRIFGSVFLIYLSLWLSQLLERVGLRSCVR